MISIKRAQFFALSLLLATAFYGCKVKYSFTGASVTPGAKTISIATFSVYGAPLAPPTLSQSLTETLKDIFLQQTNLALVKNNGDLRLEGEIVDYQIRDEAVEQDQATLTRLTITVKVRYTDTMDESRSYEQNFSWYELFDSQTSLSSVESELIDKINDQLAQNIFNKSLSNW